MHLDGLREAWDLQGAKRFGPLRRLWAEGLDSGLGDQYLVPFRRCLNLGRDINDLSEDVLVFDKSLAGVDTDSEGELVVRGYFAVMLFQGVLDGDGSEYGVVGRRERGHDGIADSLDHGP